MGRRFAWITDPHLNRLDRKKRIEFYHSTQETQVDGIFITGDISESPTVADHLTEMAEMIQKPIYFVLGNHDYYYGSFESTAEDVRLACSNSPYLFWLGGLDPIELTNNTILLGTSGWWDARWVEPLSRLVFLADFLFIEEFRKLPSYKERIKFAQKLADSKAYTFEQKLIRVLEKKYQNVVMLTHFPPFPEATPAYQTWTEKFWLPYNSNYALAYSLSRFLNPRVESEGLVLAGHTHEAREFRWAKNVNLMVGGAEFRRPRIEKILSFD